MTSVPLTPDTKSRLDALFSEDERALAETLLATECATNLPFLEKATPTDLERFRYAALKLSNGSIARLTEAINAAKKDWRDLLVAAGFADSLEAHRKWLPRKADKKFSRGP